MKLRMLGIKSAVQALLGAFVVLCADSALSQAPFYQGKTITLIVGFRVATLKEAVRKTHKDPVFIEEYRKLTGGDEPSPLMPDEQAKVVREIPRDPETVELFKKFAGTGPLPSR
jgi:hypothetical protein